jgi:hypothetical protein
MRLLMGEAINLNDKTKGPAEEVDDIAKDDDLSPKRNPMDLFASQMRPEHALALRHSLPEGTCKRPEPPVIRKAMHGSAEIG